MKIDPAVERRAIVADNIEIRLNPDHSTAITDYHKQPTTISYNTLNNLSWESDQLYATAIRCWPGKENTNLAIFRFSYSENAWTHCFSSSRSEDYIPMNVKYVASTMLSGTPGTHCSTIFSRHFKMNLDGSWDPVTKNTVSGPGALYDSVNIHIRNYVTSDSENYSYRDVILDQSEQPKTVISPLVKNLKSSYNADNHIVSIKWQNLDSTPPQLSYNIKIHKDSVSGPVVMSHSEDIPEKRQLVLKLENEKPGKYYVEFNFNDIFNQHSNTIYDDFAIENTLGNVNVVEDV